ncbi:MAG: YwqG family protein [Verrucomicrobiales bacterium]
MAIIAQINFDEIPHLKGYPKTGILQFFIAAHDDLLGWNEDNFANPGNNVGYDVRYFPKVDRDLAKLETDFTFLPPTTDYGEVFLPIEDEARLTFQNRTEFINPDDYRFTRIFGEDFYDKLGPFKVSVWNWLYDRPSSNQHKIGGWGNFAQTDPRYQVEHEDWSLLFQMDSDVEANIYWGDIGIGNFFIRPEDLKSRDFSKVAYN